VDPTRYERQIRAFHDIIGFERLGVAFENTVEGRSYAAIGDIRKMAGERNFEIVECHIKGDDAPAEEGDAAMIKCARELAPKTDAFYIIGQSVVNPKTLPEILAAMNAYKIPTFSQRGSKEVRQGVLLSIAKPSARGFAKFHGETIAKIISGAKPRDLNQIYGASPKIAFNKAAAKLIDLEADVYLLISETADEVYEEIEVNK